MAKLKLSLDIFIQQFVDIVTTTNISVSNETDAGYMEKNQPLILSGIFLGHDDDNIFLGDDSGALSDCISKRQYVHIGISKVTDKYDQMIDSIEDRSGSFN